MIQLFEFFLGVNPFIIQLFHIGKNRKTFLEIFIRKCTNRLLFSLNIFLLPLPKFMTGIFVSPVCQYRHILFCLCIIDHGLYTVTPRQKLSHALRNIMGTILQNIHRLLLHPFHECNICRVVLTVIAISGQLYIHQLFRFCPLKQNPSNFLAGKTQCFLLHISVNQGKTRIFCTHFTQSLFPKCCIKITEIMVIEHGTAFLPFQLKTVSTAIIIRIGLIHTFFESFAKFTFHTVVICIGILINVNFPACTATVLAAGCNAGKFLIIFRNP